MHILVVEDEPKIRNVLTAYLEKEGWRVDVTGDGHEAVRKFDYHQHNLILLDLMLEGISGEEVCRQVRQKSNVPIIMLTSKSRESDTIKGLNLGADDYIVKPFSVKEVIARIHALFRRIDSGKERNPSGQVLTFDKGRIAVHFDAREVLVAGRPAKLTETEFRLLSVLAERPNKVFSRSDLYYLVLGYRFQGDGRTIDMHIKNLRKKLRRDGGADCIKTKVGSGYYFSDTPGE